MPVDSHVRRIHFLELQELEHDIQYHIWFREGSRVNSVRRRPDGWVRSQRPNIWSLRPSFRRSSGDSGVWINWLGLSDDFF